jgi:hydroxylamine reductase
MKKLLEIFGLKKGDITPEQQKEINMFCYQCEQAAQGTGCVKVGVCGKQPDVAALQDLLVYSLKGIAFWGDLARQKGAKDAKIDRFMIEGLFTTVTNVDFDAEEVARFVRKSVEVRQQAKALYEKALVRQGEQHGVQDPSIDADVKSVQEILIYGIKGYAAYADHAYILGYEDDAIYAFTHKALAATLDKSLGLMDFVNLALECGKTNLVTMELLNKAHTDTYGHPVPTPVQLATKAGKAILVSGHDLKMLEELLKQTEGKGINIYTHGEMMPAHGYPGLKKYSTWSATSAAPGRTNTRSSPGIPRRDHLQHQLHPAPGRRLQGSPLHLGPGAVAGRQAHRWLGLFRRDQKRPRICPALRTIPARKFSSALGTTRCSVWPTRSSPRSRAGDIRHFFLIGGCDGAKSGRNYYTEFAENLPKDCVILTLACGKYRFNKLDFGDIGGIPRLLDVGQCNDAYSAIKIAWPWPAPLSAASTICPCR